MCDSSNISADFRPYDQSESTITSSKVPNRIDSVPGGEEQQQRAVVPKMKLKQTEVAKKIMAHKPAVTLLKNPSSSSIPPKTIVMNHSILNPTQPNERIRSKFFTRIGIDAPTAATTLSLSGQSSETSALMSSAPLRPHPREENINISQEPLKYDAQEEELIDAQLQHYRRRHQQMLNGLNGNKDNSAENDNRGMGAKGKKKINFSHNVTVLPIPMRSEYSERIKSRIWSNAMEIHENASRNIVEFAAEGWDWRQVTEDEHMYVCNVTGELIHPVHYSSDYPQGGYGQGVR